MKEFIVSDDFKACLKIKGKEYKFRSPTIKELKSYHEKAKAQGESEAINIMEDLLESLSGISKEDLEKVPADTLLSLFKHVVTPFGDEKKS